MDRETEEVLERGDLPGVAGEPEAVCWTATPLSPTLWLGAAEEVLSAPVPKLGAWTVAGWLEAEAAE